jgi:hypothetical protein
LPPLPPPLLEQSSYPISPELALVDRGLAELDCAERSDVPAATHPVFHVVESHAREAMLRICELSDVNPPLARRRVLAVAVPAALWAEALILVASVVPFGAL